MQQLHLVGFTTEHDSLIFSARKGAKSGGFLVALDDALLDTIDEAGRLRNGEEPGSPSNRRKSAPRPESALSPRDIQMRLRAGRSIANVASEAGVAEEWVMRFAVPILAEQALVIAKAQAMTFAKARLGDSGRILGESVWWNVADKGVLMAEDAFDQCWTAQHLRDSGWVVRFDFVNRKKRQRAEWEVDTREGTLVARNRLGSELGYIEPGRRGRPPAPLPPPAKPAAKAPAPASRSAAASSSMGKGTLAKRPAAKKSAAKKSAAKKSVAKKAAAKKSAAKKSTARKATAKRAPAKRAAKRTAVRRAPVKRAAVKRAPAKRAATKRSPTKRTAARRPTAKRPAAKRPAAKRPAAKKAVSRRPAPKRAATKRSAAKRAPRSRPLTASPQDERFGTPMFDIGEATRPVTIRAPRATDSEPEPPPVEVADAPVEDIVADEPIPAPPVLTSTPQPAPRRVPQAERRFGRLRRRRPPGS